ncbi:uncharacterized protein [Epargyreus clarus]|uniref:uncharacterized protein n=1 Tax=Epargyreus clarus TaxID=520877 RepID=UPI003C2D722A
MTEARSNLFARMSDRRDIVDFVKEIEKHHCLYDQNSMQYVNKLLKRRTWVDIAKKYQSTVPDCKEKWRKIRIAYMRSLKLCKSGNPPSRPYYLAPYLQFLSHKKVDDNVPTTNSPPSPVPSEDSFKLEIVEYDHLADSNEDITDSKDEMYLNRNGKPREYRRKSRVSYEDRSLNLSSSNMDRFQKEENRFNQDISREVSVRRCDGNILLENQKSYLVDENNPRRMFLMSLLPDIETLNEQEMRTFRREVIALLDRIMASRDGVVMNLSNSAL